MLTAGVPVFRLPRELVRHEIQAILSLGVDLKCNMRLGRDFTLAELRSQGYRAIFVGIQRVANGAGPADHEAVMHVCRRCLKIVGCFDENDRRPYVTAGLKWGHESLAAMICRVAFNPSSVRTAARTLLNYCRRLAA